MTPPRHERHEADKLTVVVIPGHGGSMFQWRLSPWTLGLAVLLVGAMLGAGVFALSVVSPSVNAAMTPQANLSMARTVITMTGLPIVNALPGRWLGGTAPGR